MSPSQSDGSSVLPPRPRGVELERMNPVNAFTQNTGKRTIVIGWRDDRAGPVFPPHQTHASAAMESDLPRWRTVRDAISDLGAPTGTEIGVLSPLNLHFGRNPTPKSLARYKAVPTGGNRFDLHQIDPEKLNWIEPPGAA